VLPTFRLFWRQVCLSSSDISRENRLPYSKTKDTNTHKNSKKTKRKLQHSTVRTSSVGRPSVSMRCTRYSRTWSGPICDKLVSQMKGLVRAQSARYSTGSTGPSGRQARASRRPRITT